MDIKKSRDVAEKATVNHPHPPLIHNAAAVLPFAEEWRQQYGPLYVFSIGKMQVLYVNKPELVKEITTCTSLDMGRPSYQQKVFGPLLGKGILPSNGSIWARQRKIIAPELFMEKVKGMMSIITESGLALVDSWKQKVESEEGGVVEIGVDQRMKRFSGDIISRACFGSSYSKGQEIFLKFDHLQEIMSKRTLSALGNPGLRHLPTKRNRKIWALEKEISALILKVVKERRQAGYERICSRHFLKVQRVAILPRLQSISSSLTTAETYIWLDSTSAVSASWCLMLLASNPEWQTRVRDEVEEVCQGRIPDIDMLLAYADSRNNAPIPSGANPGKGGVQRREDRCLEFNPKRFENGISGACKSPNAYMPFGFGQRVCVGQHLAMVELKLLMALILTNFSFTLSPNYVHSPVMKTIIEPKHGVQIMVKKL
ncbi:UNVERIFIED_CONTAM: cytochrome [Sesamum angustifolium]|uniref:Cytochrome n=1 Tax=Sesamum angustifolium TaxID=2727405 RepID=A0AAW2MHW5_9LAMI